MDLFDSSLPKPTQAAPTEPQQDTAEAQTRESLLEALVGEGKKFATVEDLAKGKAQSDEFIEQLKRENEGLRQDLSKALTAEEILDQIKASQTTPSPSVTPETESEVTQTGQPLTTEDITKIVEAKVGQKLSETQQANNLSSVHEEARKALGENYTQLLAQRSQEVGIDQQTLTDLAMKNPEGFLNIMVRHNKEQTNRGSSIPATERTSGVPQTGAPMSGYSDYEKLRKEDKRRFWDPKIQMEILAKAKADPDFMNR